MLKGRIHSLESFGAVDGPGIRYVVFMQGCPLRCLYCHNPDTWDASAGTEYTADELVAKITPFRAFYRGGGGVTLSGGEPLLQHEFVSELLDRLRAESFHTALDTSGAVPLEKCRDAVERADMLLLDIKSIDPEMSRRITGSGTVLQNEKDYLDFCEKTGKSVWIRHVVVPDLTMDERQLRSLGKFLERYACVKKIEPLPFHKLGEYKWDREKYTLSDTEPPTDEEMSLAQRLLGCK